MTAYGTRELQRLGLDLTPAGIHLVHNHRARTLRGLHFQTGPSAQVKVVRCLQGAFYDVALDLQGNLVRTLFHGERAGGPGQEVWNGRDLRGQDMASGVYLVRLQSGDGMTASASRCCATSLRAHRRDG